MEQSKKQKIIRMITEGNVPLNDIASKLFITEKQLRLLAESWGVQIIRKRKYRKIDRPARYSLMSLYKKYSKLDKIAEHFDVGYNTVNRWFHEYKIPTRKLKMPKEQKIKFLEDHLENVEI